MEIPILPFGDLTKEQQNYLKKCKRIEFLIFKWVEIENPSWALYITYRELKNEM